jgi:PPE-repeat protein
MRKLAIIGAAITAIVALSAIASTMATAALPEFLPTGLKFTGFGGKGTLAVSGGNTLECSSGTASGTITGPKTGTATLDLHTCKIFGLVGSHSLGDAENVILVSGSSTLCYLSKAKKEVGMIITPTGEVHVEAPSAGALAEVEGSMIGRLTPVDTTTLRFEIILKQSEGKQELLKCEGLEGETHLSTSENEGEFKPSAIGVTDAGGLLGKEGDILA